MDPEKKIPVFIWFYELGDVYLTVSVKDHPDIRIPPHLLLKEIETFVVGALPTPDLAYDNRGIKAPMRFGTNFFPCFFSWDAIISMGGAHAVIQFFNHKTDGSNDDVNKSTGSKESIEKKRKEKIPALSRKSYLRVVK